MQRKAAFAGGFYPREKKNLEQMLESCFSEAGKQRGKTQKTRCIVAPHAGYIYSGQTAAHAYSALEKAKTFIILSPNHTGCGKEISVFPAGQWQTPLGNAKINAALSEKIRKKLGIESDAEAHSGEHSIEVQLPFLQYLFGGEFDFVAITLAGCGLEKLKELGTAISKAAAGEDVAVIASSDFTHFEHEDAAKKKDLEAINRIEKLDIEGFYNLVVSRRLSICGYCPITALMAYCKQKGFKTGKLLNYGSSAAQTKDRSSVVGYAAIGFY